MKTVGIRELKNELSRYIRLVKEGETVLVTDRGTVVAELRSTEKKITVEHKNTRIVLEKMEKSGEVKRAKRQQSIVDTLIQKNYPNLPWKQIYKKTREDRV